MTSIGIVDTAVGTTGAVLESLGAAASTTDAIGSVGNVVGPVCLAVEIGLIWGMFAAGGDYSEAAIAMAMAQTILAVVLFVICLIPVVGQVVSVFLAILALVDLILGLFGGPSLSGEAAKAIAALIYDVDVLSKMGDYDFINPDNGLVYPDMGLIKGNRFRVAAQFEGDIVKGEPQGWTSKIADFAFGAFGSKLKGSYVYGEYDGTAGSGVKVVEKNESRSCDVQGEKKECSNRVEVEYQLDSAGRNRELCYKRLIHAKTHWLIIRVWRTFTFFAGSPVEIETKYTNYPDDLPEGNRWDYDTFHLDVLPDTLDGLWGWSEIFNYDQDGDGLSNRQENSLGSNLYNWDNDGDGLSDKFEFDQQGTLGTNPLKYDTDGDGLSDGDEFKFGTRIDEKDSDQDGLEDGEEVYHQNQNGTWSGGWDIPLPNKSGTVRVFSDPLNADADNDGLSDSVEKEGQSSPHAYNEAPRLTLEADPLNTSPSGVTGAYVEPGDTIVMTTTLLSLPPYGVDDDLTICLPNFLTNVEVSAMRGDRTPATEAGSCGGPKWSFDDSRDDKSDDVLRFFETVSAIITATIQSGLSRSVIGTVEAHLPYGTNKPYDEEQEIIIPVAVDLDDPQVTIVSPSEGELIGGGVEHYVTGGSSYDETSWVDHVEVNLPVAVTDTITRSQSLSPWAYTWELPVDGVYTLTASAHDFMGRVTSDTVEVMVDNTTATSTVNLEEGAVYGPPQDSAVITITLNGVASDNLSGLTRVQISTDDGPWRTVWRLEEATITDTTFVTLTDNFHDLALTATWDAIWELPNVESVQGYHSLRVRAFDEAGNEPQVLERTIIVDVIPPTSELVNRSYLYYWPHTRAGEPHTFHGVANDAGNVPAPSRPADLSDNLDVLDDATTWLGLSTIEDNDEGVSVAWLGDVNNDRRADLAVGLPAAEGGAGRVTVVYGRAGDWPVPTDLEMLADSRSSFVGESGAGIGEHIAAAGDVNGDGYDDLLIGTTTHVFLVFGSPLPLGRDVLLDGPLAAKRSEITAPEGEGIGEWMAAAGDVNGDNFDDILIGTTGAEGKTYLLLGHVGPWWETMALDFHAAATISPTVAGARLSSAGDVDGDLYSEFALATGSTVYLFEGRGSFTERALEELTLGDAIDTFTSTQALPQMAALGDVNGDDYDDFIYADDDGTARVVFGDANLDTTWTTHDTGYSAGGFLAAPGNVNDPDQDDYNDILIGDGSDAYLILGSDTGLGSAEATLSGVENAASALYAAGADLNSDGSSDLLLVPTETAAEGKGYAAPVGRAPHIKPDWLPRAPRPSSPATHHPSYGPSSVLITRYADDDGGCDGQAPCYSSIQAAVDAAGAGDTIIVHPGVYSSFTVNGKNNLTIRGAHPDAVFVDGGGGSHVVRIEGGADGVRLENLTLRNASYGVHLDNAGDPASKTILDTLFVYDFNSHAVYMNHTSAVRLTQCTIVGEDDYIEVYGDPAFDATWSTVSTDRCAATDGGGGLVAAGGDLYVLTGGGSDALHRYNGSWASLASAPRGFGPGSVAAGDGDGGLYVVRGGLLGGGVNGPVYAVAVASNGDVYVGGNFSQAYNPDGNAVSVGNIARWNGAAWDDVGGGVVESGFSADPNRPRPAQVNAIVIVGSNVYVGGRFTKAGGGGGTDALNIALWNSSSWSALDTGVDVENCYDSGVKDPTLCDVFVAAIAVDGSGNVYVGGAFSKAGDERTGPIAVYDGSLWSAVGDVHWDGPVRAIAVSGSDVYAGGAFKQAGAITPTNHIAKWDGSSWSALGDGLNKAVRALAVSGSNVYVGGAFSTAGGGAANRIARWNGSSWSALGSGLNGPVMALALDGSDVYVGGSFTQAGRYLAKWDGSWSAVGKGISTEPGVAQALAIHALALSGDEVYAGGEFGQNVARGENKSYRYDISGGSWSEFPSPPRELGGSAALTGDGNGQHLYALAGKKLYDYTISAGTWAPLASPPAGIGAGGALGWADDSVYALRGGGSDSLYRYDPVLGRWFTLSTAPYHFYAGAALAWDDQHWLYALRGGNGKHFTNYHIPTDQWQVLGDGTILTPGDDDTPDSVRAGGGLAFNGAMYAVPGDGRAELWKYDPVATYPERLTLDRVTFVAPEASAGVTWINLPFPPHDFYLTSSNSAWVGGANTVFSPTLWLNPWSPAPLYLGGSHKTVYGQARFVNLPHEFYRLGADSVLNGLVAGYHTYRGDARVAPSGAEFTSIQNAIYSGAGRVVVEMGQYEEPFYLASGVEVIGAGAGRVVIQSPSSDVLAVARAEGVMDASISHVTLNGDDRGVNGLQVEDSAQNITFTRSIVRGTDTGILVNGADTDLEVVNNTIVQNTDGMDAINCASVDVRNTIFAYHTGAGLAYQNCAATKLHTYNLFWANGDDFGGAADAGAAELFLDPLFVDLADHDYRTLDVSPVIDAGDPGDPAPPGAGSRVDIGYAEQGRTGYFVDDNFCELCDNDGLTWQLDAFDVIQDALDQAAEDLALLNVSAEEAPRLTVGVGDGVYTETVTVPSHVHLMGAASSTGAEETTIEGGVTFDGVTKAEVSDLTLTGAGSPGVAVTGASNEITITRNIIRGNPTGVAFSERGTGRVTFNTIVDNTGAGVLSSGAGAWASVNSNILSGNGTGLSADSNGQVFSNYNLLTNTTDYASVPQGDHDVVGQAPQFQTGTYRITAYSPALDAASTLADVPDGGGERADMGYRELLAAPIPIFLGQQDLSTAVGNSGVAQVEYSVVPITDTGRPVTDTLPTAWTTVTLESKGETVSYWETVYTPTVESVHRFYSRATDEVDNQETDEEDWYDGSFVADSTLPTVTWLSPGNGAPVNSPVELRAEVADYAAGEFSIEEKDVEFEIGGTIYPAQWAAEPWDEENEEPRVFRAWISTTIAAHTAYAIAEDKAGNVTSATITLNVTGQSAADTVSPALTVAWPPDGGWVTRTVIFAGTVNDTGGSGVASVEVSVDGGYLWMPATVEGSGWSLTWEGPEWQEFVSYPASVRASDQAGNVTATERVFSMDEIPPAGLAPVTFSAPEGTHFDIATTLAITWHAPVDASGVVTTLLTVDQVTETMPGLSDAVSGTSATESLDTNGEWYVHLGATDAAGNAVVRHYGPWRVGLTDAGTDFGDRRQSIVVDGYLDVENGEWLVASEFLDGDERPVGSEVTYSPQRTQSFYTTWDGGDFYLAWQGAWWELDGTLWIYVDADETGGSSQLLSSSPDTSLPFDADYAVEITGPTEGTLWHYSSGWQPSAEEWEFAQGQSGDTEIRLPLFDTEDINVVAFALDDNGLVYAVFPTVNALNPSTGGGAAARLAASRPSQVGGVPAIGPLIPTRMTGSVWEGYHWDDITVVTDPSAGQPKATSVKLTLDSPQQPTASWGPSSTLEYVVRLENLESHTIPGLQLSFTVVPTTALTFQSVDGATCLTCTLNSPWWFETDLLTGTTRITITGHLTGDLSSISAVTSIVALESISTTPGITALGILNHQIDGQPPTVTVASWEFIRHGPRTIVGTADDGDGIGVAGVEVRPQGEGWQEANGTLFWTSVVTVPGTAQHGESWSLDVRAEDGYSQTSAMQTVTFTVDLRPPTLTLSLPPTVTADLPPALGELFAEVAGTVSDSPAGSRAISVAVKYDCGATTTPTPTWLSAMVYEPDETGVQDWLWLWSVPQGLKEGHVCTLTVRSADTVGNASSLPEEQVMVDTVAPQITVTKLITIVSGATPVLSVTISDGITQGLKVIGHVYGPDGYWSDEAERNDGGPARAAVALEKRSDGTYTYVLDTNRGGCGTYKVYIEGQDIAGNSVKQGPFQFTCPCSIVGGATVPVSAFDLLLPWVRLAALVGLMLAGAVVFVRKRRRRR